MQGSVAAIKELEQHSYLLRMATILERDLQNQLRAAVVMEFIIDKLKLLNYERDFCFTRDPPWPRLHKLYFALPSNNHNEQFLCFSSLLHHKTIANKLLVCWVLQDKVAWLFCLLGQNFAQANALDDPNATCASMMVELQKLGFVRPYWSPTTLKLGYGDAVCSVLDGLTSLKLEISKFTFHPPVHQIHFYQLESPLVTGDLVGINNALFVSELEDEEDLYEKAGTRERSTPKIENKSMVLSSKVDPHKWKLELERVAPQLRFSLVVEEKDWRAHLEQGLKQHDDVFKKCTSITAKLERLETDVASTVDILESRENFINHQFEPLVSEYAIVKDRLGGIKEDHKKTLDKITTLTDEISCLCHQIEHVKQLMVEKGNAISDVSPLIQIKEAIQKLKKEIQDMEVCIGVLEHSLIKVGFRQARNGGTEPILHF